MTENQKTEFSAVKRLFATDQFFAQKRHVGTQKDKKNKLALIIQNGNFLCLSCSRASLPSQHDVFVSRDSSAAKGLSTILVISGFLLLNSLLCFVSQKRSYGFQLHQMSYTGQSQQAQMSIPSKSPNY